MVVVLDLCTFSHLLLLSLEVLGVLGVSLGPPWGLSFTV